MSEQEQKQQAFYRAIKKYDTRAIYESINAGASQLADDCCALKLAAKYGNDILVNSIIRWNRDSITNDDIKKIIMVAIKNNQFVTVSFLFNKFGISNFTSCRDAIYKKIIDVSDVDTFMFFASRDPSISDHIEYLMDYALSRDKTVVYGYMLQFINGDDVGELDAKD